MPELPEVETIAKQLKPSLLGQTIRRQEIFDPKLRHLKELQLQGSAIRDISRLGKQILITLDGGIIPYIAVHLRMTGSLLWEPHPKTDSNLDRANHRTPDSKPFNSSELLVNHQQAQLKHRRWVVELEKGNLVFSDIRRFGTVTPCHKLELLLKGSIDPLDKQFTLHYLKSVCAKTSRAIKVLLLDQSKILGIGNIYASEILYRCKIDPRRQANSLKARELTRLHLAIQEILLAAIKHNGTTFSDYRDSKGEKGSFQNLLAVYDRENSDCVECSGQIMRIVQAQRSTFFCPICQA